MAAKYILAALAAAFVAAALMRWRRDSAAAQAQTKIWLLIGVIFAAVSAWLFSTT